MDLFYGIHPPSEVHVPEAMRRKDSRSRSPSPLSLRDPQDDGEYHNMGESSDEEGHKKSKPIVQQRPTRPLPLSLAAASLDLPSLTHPRHHSPLGNNGSSQRRLRWGLPDLHNTSGEDSSLQASSPKALSTVTAPTPLRTAEAPFDEGSPKHVAPSPVTTTPPRASSTSSAPVLSLHENSPSSPPMMVVPIVGHDMMEEPPACELQEPPSLKTFRRPLSSAMPPVTSPPPAQAAAPVARNIHAMYHSQVQSPEGTKSLPFEDECDESPTLRNVEEKKTNEPSPSSSRYSTQSVESTRMTTPQRQQAGLPKAQTKLSHRKSRQESNKLSPSFQKERPVKDEGSAPSPDSAPPASSTDANPTIRQHVEQALTREKNVSASGEPEKVNLRKMSIENDLYKEREPSIPSPLKRDPDSMSGKQNTEDTTAVVGQKMPSSSSPQSVNPASAVSTAAGPHTQNGKLRPETQSGTHSPPKSPRRWPVPRPEPMNDMETKSTASSPPFSPSPQARSWMEKEGKIRPLAPSIHDPPLAKRRAASQDVACSESEANSVVSSATDQASSTSLPSTFYHSSQRSQARERIKNRIRMSQSFENTDHADFNNTPRKLFIHATQSFEHPEGSLHNPIEIQRSTSLDINRSASVDLDRSISSLPETFGGESIGVSPQKPRSLYDPNAFESHLLEEEIAKRQRRLEMSQAEYIAMRAKQTTPEKDKATRLNDEAPISPIKSMVSSSHIPSDAPGDIRKTENKSTPPRVKSGRVHVEAIDPPLERTLHVAPTSPIVAQHSPNLPPNTLKKTTSMDGRHFRSPESAMTVSDPLLPKPLQKTTSLDGPHFQTPGQHYNAPVSSANRTNQTNVTMDPPSLRRPRGMEDDGALGALPVPQTPRSRAEEPPSLSKPPPQETTPRRSNATTPVAEARPRKTGLVNRSFQSEKPEEAAHNDGESISSADTASLIASLDDLVKDLEGMANSEAPVEQHNLRPSAQNDTAEFFKPLLVQSINNDLGIPKGDIMLSLLNESTERTWASRVTEAIWRCRTMRQNCDTKWLRQKLQRGPGSPSKGRTSVAVDIDDNAIVGGIETVEETQKSALEHLKYDDFEDAMALYENIAGSYHRYFEGLMSMSSDVPHMVLLERLAYFKAFVGACMHNIGIIHLLRGEYAEAHMCFERATMKRAECHGVGTADHLVSLLIQRSIVYLAKNVSHDLNENTF